MKQKLVYAYLKTAKIFADCSTAVRLKVGAIIVRDDKIISIGYNGTPAGWDNNCENTELMPQSDLALSPEEILKKWPFEGRFWINGQERNTRYRLVTKPEVMHAERNALDKLAKHDGGGKDSFLFVTHAPCIDCAKSIYGSGIISVYYETEYRNDEGVKFLKNCGIQVKKVNLT